MALKSMGDESEVSALNGRLALRVDRHPDRMPVPAAQPTVTLEQYGRGLGDVARALGGSAVEVFYHPEIPIGTVDLVDVDGNVIATVRDVASVRLGTGE